MADGKVRHARLTRRGFIGGVAASAAAAILAACGGGSSPTATRAPTASAPTSAATAASGTATTATTAATRAATSGSAVSGTAAATTSAATTSAATSVTTSGSAVAASGPVGTIAPPAPATFKGKTLTMLSRQEYFMGEQTAFDVELQAWSKLTGASIDNTHINQDQGDFAPRQDAAVKGGSVQDMCYCTGLVSQWQQLSDITDVSDVVADIQQAYGPVEDYLKSGLFIDGKWWAIPYYSNVTATFLRKDWLDAKGVKVSDIKTFENARDVALEISDPTKNQFGWGITWNRSGDGNYLITSVLNSYGGAVYSDDGKKVVFNSPESIAAISFLADIYTNAKYRTMLPPGVNGWTDPSNNQAWLAGLVGFTQNAYTLYAQSKADKNPVYDHTAIIPGLIGPGTEQVIPNPGYGAFVIFKGAKNPDLAKATAKYMVGGTALLDIAKQANGIVMPAYKKQWDANPFWSQGDPSFSSLRTLIEGPLPITSKAGYHFPQTPSGAGNAVSSQYVLPDMMGDIVLKGTKVVDAVKTANDRMVQIFEQFGNKQ
jgi:multiple sugar transport system substrate-binding protein